jgi:hypothetical protein
MKLLNDFTWSCYMLSATANLKCVLSSANPACQIKSVWVSCLVLVLYRNWSHLPYFDVTTAFNWIDASWNYRWLLFICLIIHSIGLGYSLLNEKKINLAPMNQVFIYAYLTLFWVILFQWSCTICNGYHTKISPETHSPILDCGQLFTQTNVLFP